VATIMTGYICPDHVNIKDRTLDLGCKDTLWSYDGICEFCKTCPFNCRPLVIQVVKNDTRKNKKWKK